MAFLKQRIVRGIPCNYLKLSNINSDLLRGVTTFTVAVYFSRDARMTNSEHIQEYITEIVDGAGYTVENAYRKLKESRIGHDMVGNNIVDIQKNWFFDAQDVFELPPPPVVPSIPIVSAVKKTPVKRKRAVPA